MLGSCCSKHTATAKGKEATTVKGWCGCAGNRSGLGIEGSIWQ